MICKRGEQQISIEFATDNEFDAWVKTNAIPIKENGITAWSFDDRCRLINHVLAHGGTLEFVDGTRLPVPNENNSADETNSEGEQNSPGFLEYVAQAREIIRANPTIESAELAQLLGLKSKIYAHQVKVFVNASKDD